MKSKIRRKNSSKTVLITGCSSGFGMDCAVAAAKAGYDVVATMRNLDKSQSLKRALAIAQTDCRIEQLDVTDQASMDRLVEKIGKVDILVNNAGILIAGAFVDQTAEEERLIFETNYFGVVHLTKAIAKGMIQRKAGRIINIASLAGLVGHPYNAAYGASKHALIGFTKSIRVELALFGIDVVSIEPGYHKTQIIGMNANQSENFYDRKSPMYEWNRGFLRVMMDVIIPNAGECKDVVDVMMKAIMADKPKAHYVVGKDAKIATILNWLGLGRWLEKKVLRKIRKGRRRENKREAQKKARRKQARDEKKAQASS
ncbi:MAG: SDR family oxidoreductase [Planctomycetota bacterium]|jgi:NAD(P)-dependent dehydrogenase (short-subunit alcohol dehydrogenase family)